MMLPANGCPLNCPPPVGLRVNGSKIWMLDEYAEKSPFRSASVGTQTSARTSKRGRTSVMRS